MAAPLWTSVRAPELIAGNRPILLDDPDAVWWVAEGRLDVFAVALRDGAPTGPRTFLWEVGAGSAAPGGYDSDSRAVALLAVAGGPTRVVKLTRAVLEELATVRATRSDVAALLESVVIGAAAGVASREHPRIQVELAPGSSVALKDGGRVGAAQICWVRVVEGGATLGGDPACPIGTAPRLHPIGPGMWLDARRGTRLEAISTERALEEGVAWDGLRESWAQLEVWAQTCVATDASQESARLRARTLSDGRMFERSMAGLASVLDTAEVSDPEVGVDDPLVDACFLIGRHGGIRFRPPPRWEIESRSRNILGSLCRASRVRYRRVALRGAWWETDAGALLGHMAETGAPVALLPSALGTYEMVDPVTSVRTLVTRDVAGGLQPFAHSFYRPAPERALGGRDLVDIALHGVGGDFSRVLLLALASGLLSLAFPLATSRFFSIVIPSSEVGDVWVLLVALVAVTAGTALFDLARAFLLIRVETKSNDALQAAVVDRLLGLPVSFFRKYAVGDLARRAASINQVREKISGAATQSILGGGIALMNLLLLFRFNAKLAWVAVTLLLSVSAFTAFFARRTLGLERERQDLQGRIAGLVFQMVGGIAKLRVAEAERRAFAVWARLFRSQQWVAFKAGLNQAAVRTLNGSLPLASTLVLFAVAGHLLSKGTPIAPGTFIAFSAAFGTVFSVSTQLTDTIVSLMQLGPTLARARPILSTPPEVDEFKPDPGELAGRIEGSHLTFRYRPDGPLVLDDLSFRASPGEFVAFVGPSGSGKSTSLRLLLGFDRPESGTVYFDNQALDQLDVTAVRGQIGVVLQGSQLMAGNIFHNIVGMAPLTMDDAWEAAEAAGIAEDIREMPMGMNTVISDGSPTLSGGQRQRLLIARALARKPRIVFFDEATSALDNRTQELVSRSLEATKATRIVIAHRLSTVRHADRIYVIDRGRVVQEGTFDDLVAQAGLFGRLVARQMA